MKEREYIEYSDSANKQYKHLKPLNDVGKIVSVLYVVTVPTNLDKPTTQTQEQLTL